MQKRFWSLGAISLAIMLTLNGCAAQATEIPEKTAPLKKEVQWSKDKLKMGEDGVPLLRVYVDGNIETMDLESYVEGVLAGEMKNDWPMEALKAQAILARTFVLKFVEEKDSKYEGADISTDIEEAQAYDASGVNDRIKQAVGETKGQVLSWNGELPYSWFHSHSGGKTDYAVEGLGWDKDEPGYTKIAQGTEPESVEEEKENAQLKEAASWKATFTLDEFEKACKKAGAEVDVTGSTKLKIGQKGESGRAVTLLVDGTEVDAAELRIAIGSKEMRSTLLVTLEIRDGKVYMSGKGYGHGVGMSQWGAYGMAQDGKTAEEIIRHYFQDTDVQKIW